MTSTVAVVAMMAVEVVIMMAQTLCDSRRTNVCLRCFDTKCNHTLRIPPVRIPMAVVNWVSQS